MKAFLFLISVSLFHLIGYSQSKGIDVSKFQGEINWEKVAQDSVDFVFIRSGQGLAIKDEKFNGNWREAKRAGLKRGAYHFFVGVRDAKKQARKFWRRIKCDIGEYRPAVDVERLDGLSPEELRLELRVFLDEFERRSGITPIIYSGDVFYRDHLKDHFPEYLPWLARYRKKGPEFEDWGIWQLSDKGKVNGIKGDVDLNQIHASVDSFQHLTNVLKPYRQKYWRDKLLKGDYQQLRQEILEISGAVSMDLLRDPDDKSRNPGGERIYSNAIILELNFSGRKMEIDEEDPRAEKIFQLLASSLKKKWRKYPVRIFWLGRSGKKILWSIESRTPFLLN